MTVVLDAGALIAMERGDRDVANVLLREQRAGRAPVTHGGIIGQVWRGGRDRQAGLARALQGIDVMALDLGLGRAAGALLAATGTDDVLDAAVVLLARNGDEILTSDPMDLRVLAEAADLHVLLVPV